MNPFLLGRWSSLSAGNVSPTNKYWLVSIRSWLPQCVCDYANDAIWQIDSTNIKYDSVYIRTAVLFRRWSDPLKYQLPTPRIMCTYTKQKAQEGKPSNLHKELLIFLTHNIQLPRLLVYPDLFPSDPYVYVDVCTFFGIVEKMYCRCS